MDVCVFLSSVDLDERFSGPAEALGRLLGERGHTLVWGGCDAGLMRVVADGAAAGGGRMVGVSVEFLAHRTRWSADEVVMAGDLAERKAVMLERSDAVVVLAGGLGTLDEAAEVLELKKHGRWAKPVVFVNSAGFYDGLETQLRRMDAEGFLPVPLDRLAWFADGVVEAVDRLESAEPAVLVR
ncbi:TIGR00730 family Rossman fold protein [Streptomyces sp. NPDC020807]|uniref:LOG family protein n=1 Tax=Streptomyces sp. NPDC020807 TaxID=3155119 RepID=UPI003408C1BA